MHDPLLNPNLGMTELTVAAAMLSGDQQRGPLGSKILDLLTYRN
jgi:hypothetical protein